MLHKTTSFLAVLTCVALAAACSDSQHSAESTDSGVADASTDAEPSTDAALDQNAPTSDASPDTSPDAGPLAPVQMNDVSILFPMGTAADVTGDGYLRATSSGSRGTLLPKNVYDATGGITGTGPAATGAIGAAFYANLRIVSLRVDPCFAATAPSPHGDGCDNQLRLVVQELSASGNDATAFDSSMHLFYSLSRAELTALVRELVALRVANGGGHLGALAPHPIVVAQGLSGSFAAGVRAIVLKYAGDSNLRRVTLLSSSNADFNWTFSGFDITDAKVPTVAAMHIPTLTAGPKDTSQLFFRGFGQDPTGDFTPATTSADDMTALMNVTTSTAMTAPAQQKAYDALLRIENPTLNTPNTIDCASCHLTTPAAKLVAEPKLALSPIGNANAFIADPAYVVASDMVPTFDAKRQTLNVHAFAYSARDAGISQRTVNETAAVVAYWNANLAK